MKKIVIPCIISCALIISNTALGMLARYCKPQTTRIVSQQRKYNSYSETHHLEMITTLARQSHSLKMLSDDLKKIKSTLDTVSARQEHMAKLYISTITDDPNKRTQLYYEFLKGQMDPINPPKTNTYDDFLKHEFGDNRLHI